ncbi:hypothetical protein V6N13_106962 [Hibiscus sabdariffa]|uniref:Uncharacterized protein n=1 Tax=Hibiscus sabdariffa TaxID=183260 RepID=A0ABR2F2B0_9ROSI
MLHILRFAAGFVIVFSFVLHALKSCSVHADQAAEEAVIQKEFHGRKIGRLEVVASKDSGAHRFDGKCEFEGKGKYCNYWNENSSDPLKVETPGFVALGADYGGPKRKNNDADIMSTEKSQDQPNNQVRIVNKLEEKTLGTPRNDEAVIGNKYESKRLLEAAKEVVNLMQKDYRDRPGRKPPINNHVPRH